MPTKSPSSKNKATKNEKNTQRLTFAQIAFGIFALLLIVTMVLGLVVQN